MNPQEQVDLIADVLADSVVGLAEVRGEAASDGASFSLAIAALDGRRIEVRAPDVSVGEVNLDELIAATQRWANGGQ